MPLQSSGAISLNDIQTEFGGSNPISLSEYYAGGSFVAAGTTGDGGAIPSSGAISIGDFYGAAARVSVALTISGTTQNYNIYANRGGTYSAGKTDVVLTVQAIVGSAGTGQYAIDTGNQWASGDTVKIINNSQIVGCGGAGGTGAAGQSGTATNPGGNGGAGGSAINLGFDTTIQNNGGFIRGAGGGGGGSSNASFSTPGKQGAVSVQSISGAGGGGGAGQNGGAGGSAGATMTASQQNLSGNAGQAGSISGPGAPGSAQTIMSTSQNGGGGQGGGFGQAGQNGGVGQANTSEGGKSNAAGGAGGTGGAAGKAINLGGNSLTWEDGNSNVQGAVS